MEIMTRIHGVNPIDPRTDLDEMYADWINRVKETVSAKKLLVFNVKQGWKPLCDFLGVPVPDTPFPRVNSACQSRRVEKAKLEEALFSL